MLATHTILLLPALCSSLLLSALPGPAAVAAASASGGGSSSGLRFEPESNSYSGLTFTFDPRLDKRVEWLHFDHWLSIMQHSSALLYESLNGRAHLAEVRVLIPYKWRQAEWPVLHKPGVPIIMNRRLQYVDSDVIVGFEDPIYKETPYAIQHDECSKQGLNIHMPISFLEQNQPTLDPKLKARLLVREFASHRYGVFKESGFRSDYMYPPFSSLAGYARPTTRHHQASMVATNGTQRAQQQLMMQQLLMLADGASGSAGLNQSQQQQLELLAASVRGFDENWNECQFDTSPASGLPLPQALNCAPYLTTRASLSSPPSSPPSSSAAGPSPTGPGSSVISDAPLSFNLMSSDPFAHSDLGPRLTAARIANQPLPVEWRQLADSVKWHFCGENFPPSQAAAAVASANYGAEQVAAMQARDATSSQNQFAHNQLASNKQNVMCNERSAMDVIRSHEDFRRTPFSPSTFNRLPATNFKFLQEMPPRLILCVEYSGHLYQSRRLEHGILEAAVGKFLAYDLIADTEMALVLFGQQHSTRTPFKRLDSSVDSRLTLYSPPLDPYDEQARFYTEQELLQLDVQPATASQAKLIKGTCSLAKALAEAGASLQQQRGQYDDVGADLVILTSGLFIEDEQKIEEILRSGGWARNDNLQLNLIIYPAAMLFGTRSGRGDGSSSSSVALDPIESESIIRNRISKLLLIQRLMPNTRLHLVREHLDANGNVKMSTLLQFYQIFEHISRGHSWDQTHSMNLLAQQTVETRHNLHQHHHNQHHHLQSSSLPAINGSKLSFQFQLDNSIQNELIVGFLDPKQHQLARSGKRFALKNLQLRSPGGYLLLTDSHPWCVMNSSPPQQYNQLLMMEQPAAAAAAAAASGSQDNQPATGNLHDPSSGNPARADQQLEQLDQDPTDQRPAVASSAESALFPYRTQLSLAGFHLRASHLAQLNATNRLTGTWTLTATSDEPIQTDALAMARANPTGDTVTARCWIQTYHHHHHHGNNHQIGEAETSSQHRPLKSVKVFVQTRAGARMGPVQELDARMEVQDELGNIVQNVNMLDDGLGAPDMTRGDGIHSQYVMRAHRSGFYRVSVELTGSGRGLQGSSSSSRGGHGQDGACCGSVVPSPSRNLAPDTRHLNRQLYCGTFYAEPGNRLAQQKPPRVNNITVVNVDQENRRVTIRWLEPSVDISSSSTLTGHSNKLLNSENELPPAQELDATSIQGHEAPQALVSSAGSVTRISRPSRRHSPAAPASSTEEDESEEQTVGEVQQSELLAFEMATMGRQPTSGPRGLIMAGNHINQPPTQGASGPPPLQAGNNRYEIKLFTDRDMLKRAFDAKQEVGFRFTEWNVEGSFPNASAYGGVKEVTLRVPYGREGVYYIAMKVYNNLGIGSQLSHIVQFWLRNNLTLEEAESIYGQSGGTIDAEGNVYDKNGELIHQRGSQVGAGGSGGVGQLSYLLPRRPGGGLDGISVLVLISVLAFVFSVVCISLVACLASSARRSLAKRDPADDKKAVTGGSSMGLGAGSGSSMVSSGCESSQQSEVASSAGSSHCGGHDVEINKLSLAADELAYTNNLQQQHQNQQHQAQLIEGQMMMAAHNHHHHHHQEDATTNHMSYQQQQQYSDAIYQQHLNQFTEQVGDSGPGKSKQQWLQHTMVNGYAYATVNGGQPAQVATEGDLNQNGLGASTMSPVQSWPADILLSHYDKVKQARERNEAPPVMRIETLEHQGGPFGGDHVGLPVSLDHQQDAQRSHSPPGGEQNYLVRQQRNQMPSYFNLQLQQQLSSVLKSKQRHQHQQHQQPLEPMDEESSPALEGVRDLHDPEAGGYPMQMDSQHSIAPPPQYVYCAPPTDENGLMVGGGGGGNVNQQGMISEPSIYSQVTNLQQVTSADQSRGASYYANQVWPPPAAATEAAHNTNHNHQQSSHYSSSSLLSSGGSQINEHQQFGGLSSLHQQTRVKLVNEDYATDNKSNSAISEV